MSFPLMPIPAQWSGSGPNLTYVGSTLNPGSATTYTFTNHAIGVASADRYVIIIGSGVDVTNTRQVLSATIGGVAATLITRTNAGSDNAIGMYGLLVPSGTTATITVTMSGGCARGAVSVYTMTGWQSTAPASTGAVHTSATTQTLTLATPYGARTLAYACHDNTSAGTWSGTSGIVNDYSAINDGFVSLYMGRGPMNQAEATLSTTATLAGGATQFCLIAATFT